MSLLLPIFMSMMLATAMWATPHHTPSVTGVQSVANDNLSITVGGFTSGGGTVRLDTVITQLYYGDTVHIRVRLDSIEIGGYALVTEEEGGFGRRRLSRWIVRHPVFRIAVGDIDGNGSQDVCLGAIKTTRHDPVARKRLLVYSLRSGYIRPLWLGSFLGQTMDDFALVADSKGAYIATVTGPRGDRRPECHHWRWRVFGFTHEGRSQHVSPAPAAYP